MIKLGGWVVKDKLFAQVKIASDLWYFTGRGSERQVHLFFVGWYENGGKLAKLFTVNVLWVSIQIGF